MKTFSFTLWVGLLILLAPGLALAKERVGPGPSATLSEEMAQRQEKESKAAAMLNGSTWAIELVPLSGEKSKKSIKDTLAFEEGKISSSGLTREGYPTSNYTLTVSADGTVVWETMQTREKSGVVFWRGERREDTMRGILSRHPAEGTSVDYSFSGKLVEFKPVTVLEPPAHVPAPVAATPPAAPAVQKPVPSAPTALAQQEPVQEKPHAAPQKQKKGWWW